MEPVVEVLAEPAGGDELSQVRVRRRDHPEVHGNGGVGSDRRHATLLEDPEELHLVVGTHGADLVQEDRPGVRQLEVTRPVAVGARERATNVTEQLRLDDLGGDRPAVHRDERAVAPRAQRVDRPRQDLLPDAALAQDEHVRVGSGEEANPLADRRHDRARAGDPLEGILARGRGVGAGERARERSLRERKAQSAAVPTQDQDRRPRVGPADPVDEGGRLAPERRGLRDHRPEGPLREHVPEVLRVERPVELHRGRTELILDRFEEARVGKECQDEHEVNPLRIPAAPGSWWSRRIDAPSRTWCPALHESRHPTDS